MSLPLLQLEGLGRQVDGRTLLAEVDCALAPGEVVAILGPSGSGKTSLLRLIAGFDAPSTGRVWLQGRLASQAPRVLLPPEQRALAIAFQDATLFAHLDAVANVAFAIRRGGRTERLAQAREALRGMGLDAMDGRDVATLSGGEAQRVSLARALAADARLLLLDEPFGNVDRLTRADLLGRLKARLAAGAGSGPAAVIVTHDPADAVELGARVLLMRAGRLVADGHHEALAAGAQGDWARDFLRAP